MSGGFESVCRGKLAFDSYHAAERSARPIKKRTRQIGFYRCQYCHKWHISGANSRDRTSSKGKKIL